MIINPYRYAAAGGGGNRYMRLRITANNGDSVYCLQELEIRQSAGGADTTTTTTPITATSTLSALYPAVKMVDNSVVNDQDVWVSQSAPGTVDIVIDGGSGFDMASIVEVALMPQNNAGVGPGRAPKDFTIAIGGSTAGPWTTVKTVTGSTGWTAGAYRTFAIP